MEAILSGDQARRRCICIDGDTTVLTASRLMRSFEVEELVVTNRSSNALVPAGIVSARDIVTRVIARQLDPTVLTAGDIAWTESALPDGNGGTDSLRAALTASNRVLPLLDREGHLAGVVSQHELLSALVPTTRP